ncbi:tetratricopeptide repeat protein, partial [Streptomyces sp. APSN-46.1]
GALTTITEATDLYRALAQNNPAAYLPNLATSLNNLANHQAETGNQQGALTTITEAVTIRRDLAQNNPAAYLPNLATSLNNLANRQAETGDQQGALTTITEAVTIRRALAQNNPAAYLPNLATSLNNLARITTPQDALAAYAEAERALVSHPGAARYLAVQRGELEIIHVDSDAGLRTLISVARNPLLAGETDPAALRARELLRAHCQGSTANASQVRGFLRDTTGAEHPAWLALPQAALDLAADWINCASWADARAFWDEHSEDLRSAETSLALEELTLVSQVAEAHLRIVRDAEATDADSAFRPYLTGELLHTWTGLSTWEESQAYLTEHVTFLLHDQALELLGSDLKTADSAVHHALITLARADGIPAAYHYVEDRAALRDRLQQLMTAPPEVDPDLLQAVAHLERSVYEDAFTGAAHLALAAALAGSPAPPTAWPPAEPADRDRVISEAAGLIGRHPQHAAALSALIQSLLAA